MSLYKNKVQDYSKPQENQGDISISLQQASSYCLSVHDDVQLGDLTIVTLQKDKKMQI